MENAVAALHRLLAAAGVPYAIIGAHAVNVWTEPRVTADVDVTIAADVTELRRLRQLFEAEGLRLEREHGAALSSGPDFMRFVSADGIVTFELQTAKTAFQREVIRRAATSDEVRIATVEDLIVMKLIADRPKDQADLSALVVLPAVDWTYVERWAEEWEVVDRLRRFRPGPS